MSNRGDDNFVIPDEIRDEVGKHRTIYSPVATAISP